MEEKYNEQSLDTLCAALCEVIGIDHPSEAADPAPELIEYVVKKFAGRKADRVFMYNPDAIGQWVEDKYPEFLEEMTDRVELDMPFKTVMPSVTPVCFATMYTGAQPSVHGIQKYTKPVLTIDTIFDALIRAGKKVAIIGDDSCSIGKIFLEREMDYFLYESIPEITAKAVELILEDKHDFIVVYHGDYDSVMHGHGPEANISLAQLCENAAAFSMFYELIKNNWKQHDTLLGFAMDHGCHEIDGGNGAHGLDMTEDLNIRHHYVCLPKE